MGDFNFPHISCEYHTPMTSRFCKYLTFVGDNVSHALSEPTRKNVPLDLLFVNRERSVGRVAVGGCLGQSDHEILDFLFVDTETARHQLYLLNVHKSMGPDGILPGDSE